MYLVFFPNRSLFVEQELAEAIFMIEVLFLPPMGWVSILTEVNRQEMEEAQMPSRAHFEAMIRSNLAMLQEVFLSTMRTTCMIMLILMAAFTLQFAFAYLRISHALADLVVSLDLEQWQLVGILVIFYLLLGTFMESYSMLATTLPILLETLFQSGIDLLWFGIIMIFCWRPRK